MLVMIIDDSVTMRKIVGMTVKSAGHEVLEAQHGLDALDKLDAGAKPDFFLVDINMPEMNGIDFVKVLRQKAGYAKTPAVFITTESEQAMKDEGTKAGGNGWLVKPFEKEDLQKVMAGLA